MVCFWPFLTPLYMHVFTFSLDRPNSPRIQTREVKERAVTLRWTPVFDGGRPITSYNIDLKNKQGELKKTIPVILIVIVWISSMYSWCTALWSTSIKTILSNPHLTEVTLVDLSPAKTYNLRMFASNSMGISESSNVLTVTTKEAGRVSQSLLF